MSVNVYDTVTASVVEVGDQIRLDQDEIEVTSVEDDGSVILIKGYSYSDGDSITLELDPDALVDLWMV